MAQRVSQQQIQQVYRVPVRHAAARLVRERNHAVNIGEFRARVNLAHSAPGDLVRLGRRAHPRGHNADVVARSYRTIGSHKAVEGQAGEAWVNARQLRVVAIAHLELRQPIFKILFRDRIPGAHRL